MGCCNTFVRYIVCLMAFLTWLLGSSIIAYTLWMLSTSANVKRIFEGTAPVTYVALGLGALLFINGLLGWMGSSSKRGGCLLKMFLFLCVLTIAAEIGGIISLSILKVKVTDIIEQGWTETNPKSRNLIQDQFECCGLTGPSEFAKTADPIDASCYHILKSSDMTPAELASFNSSNSTEPIREMHKIGCKEKLVNWISKHKMIWISAFGGFLLFQAVCFCLTVSAVNMKSRSSSLDSLDQLHNTYM